jgi:hypothetical protein
MKHRFVGGVGCTKMHLQFPVSYWRRALATMVVDGVEVARKAVLSLPKAYWRRGPAAFKCFVQMPPRKCTFSLPKMYWRRGLAAVAVNGVNPLH